MIYTEYLNTQIGCIKLQATAQGIIRVDFFEGEKTTIRPNEMTHCCKQQLKEYFNGKRKMFDTPLDQQGTIFQRSVWDCLLQIPFGQVVSYSDIAEMINNPKAARAVGTANGKNPISIIVPCHRVIGSNGTLAGYAGGLARKSWLLRHEGNRF